MIENGPLIGILGGMGPLATADFMNRMAQLAKAVRDQDHCRILVYSNPRIPDRSDAMLGLGPSPLAGMIDGLGLLERCGADLIAIPCNTAHFWLKDLVRATGVPILSIVDAVRTELVRRRMIRGRIGLLGTSGMVQSDVYQRDLAPSGYEVIVPTGEGQSIVQAAIRSVKAGRAGAAQEALAQVIRDLGHRGAEAVILGCTELPIALPEQTAPCGMPLVDSTHCLAEACLAWVSDTERRRSTARSPQSARAVERTGVF